MTRQAIFTIIGSCFYLCAAIGGEKLNSIAIALVGIANVLFILK